LPLYQLYDAIKYSMQPETFFMEEDKPLDLRRYLGLLLRFWYLFVIIPALAFTIAWLYLRYTPKTYEVHSTVLIKGSEEGSVSDLTEEVAFSDLGSGLLSSSINLENEMQILKSRSLMKAVVDSLNLNVQYLIEGRIAESELYGNSPVVLDSFHLPEGKKSLKFRLHIWEDDSYSLYPYGGDVGPQQEAVKRPFGKWSEFGEGRFLFRRLQGEHISNYKDLVVVIRDPEQVAQQYAGQLGVKRREYSFVLDLSMRDFVPEKAVDILNQLYVAYDIAAREDKNTVARNTLNFVENRLRILARELSAVEGDVVSFKQQHGVTTQVEANVGMMLSQLQEFDQRLSELDLQRELLDRMEGVLREGGQKFEVLPAAFSFDNQDLNALIAQYNQGVLQRDRLLQGSTGSNPAVEALTQELKKLHGSLLENLALVREQLDAHVRQLQRKAADLMAKAHSIPRVERDLLQIERQRSIKENLFLYLLQKREESALSLAVTASDFRIVDPPARFQAKVIKPQKAVVYALSLLLGLGLPVLFIFLTELFNNKIQSEEDVTSRTGVPVLGKLAESKKKKFLVVREKSRSAIAEMFRLLRTNLNFLLPEGKRQVLLVSSGTSGDGKTFVSANLGMSLALSGKRTVLLGMDLRKPKLCANLVGEGSCPPKGLTNYLIGEAAVEEIVYPLSDIHPNLFLIPSGPQPPNPAELLMQKEKMEALFAYLRTTYELVIIDTPPVGMVADPLLLKDYIDGTLLIVRDGYTPKEVLKTIDEIYTNKKLPHPAIIINGIKAQRGYGYGYGYGYGDGYGYYEQGT